MLVWAVNRLIRSALTPFLQRIVTKEVQVELARALHPGGVLVAGERLDRLAVSGAGVVLGLDEVDGQHQVLDLVQVERDERLRASDIGRDLGVGLALRVEVEHPEDFPQLAVGHRDGAGLRLGVLEDLGEGGELRGLRVLDEDAPLGAEGVDEDLLEAVGEAVRVALVELGGLLEDVPVAGPALGEPPLEDLAEHLGDRVGGRPPASR